LLESGELIIAGLNGFLKGREKKTSGQQNNLTSIIETRNVKK